ncbi:MAG TPA: penicillin-binding protein 1C [Candidatus Limnocylindrales bacterium]|nr:penicillin-binding protein 1C [Candidatus Limnocylindrales bacterium]
MKRAALVVLGIVVVLRFWPHQPLSARVPLSTGVWSADGELLRVTLAADDQYRLWTPLKDIAPVLVDAFLLKEDRWFYWHPGVNPIALSRAALRAGRGGGRQGASTITMQLARLLYGLRTRSAAGKARQIALALWLEARYSKHDLLEAYLNLAPFGGNVQGAGAASRLFFGKPPSRVSLAEAVTMAVIPQSPSRGHGLHEDRLAKARRQLAALWMAHHRVSETDARQLATAIGAHADFPMPYLAPHFVDALLAGSPDRPARIDTTLDSSLQRLLEHQIRRYIEEFGDRGIRNASALLVDSRSMTAKAWAGSADYWNRAIDGEVDGVLAKRSPGSALKPFIYAMALDQGLLHPRTILRDAPTSFGPFTPENFDGRFFGPIPAEEALIRSRNVPAVSVAMRLRQPNLYSFLRSAGVSRMKDEAYYGLALALGGGEVSMEELAGLYGILANGGELRPVRAVRSSTRSLQAGVRMISPEAAFITLDMLHKNPRPDDDGALPRRSRWPVAWKTGTSWGFRDAWSAGVAGPFVLVVWIGDFSGQGNPAFVGVDAAAPLFFRIVDAVNLVHASDALPLSSPPPGVSRVAVCAESGDLPNSACPQTVDTWYIPGKSPIRVSQLHRVVAMDVATGRPVCPPYLPANTRLQTYEFWSSDMLKLFREAGMPRRVPPALPACAADDSSDSPRIASPLRDVTYTLRRTGEGSIALEAGAAGDVREMFWFDGAALIGKVRVAAGALPWRPSVDGAHLIRVIDDHGRAAERDVAVQFNN